MSSNRQQDEDDGGIPSHLRGSLPSSATGGRAIYHKMIQTQNKIMSTQAKTLQSVEDKSDHTVNLMGL